jgi:fructan beta-fructosidase
MKSFLVVAFSIFCFSPLFGQRVIKEFLIGKQYLNFPVDMKQERQKVEFVSGKDTLTYSVIRISDEKPDYWVFKDVSAWKGKKLKLIFSRQVNGIDKIYQSDTFAGQDSLYRETNRPQFHFTSRRGWNNDPNGLVYLNGEYHLFYQHNPYETQWENMHWGHAVSRDLLHWKELNDALYPDTLGTMFSGSAVIDKENTAGWGKDALVAFYTAAGKKMTQNIAYSLDNGRSFTKYRGNPVLGPDRDPKVFWYEPAKIWVMALFDDNYIAIYNSKDLKNWEYKSKTKGFFECPELFELPVDGNGNNKKCVLYGGSGAYMTGSFNGQEFKPEYGKYYYTWGSLYAAQTYNDAPGGRRIQIGWGRIEQPGMPFNQMMLFPCELTLRTTPEGIRLFCEPIREIRNLYNQEFKWKDLSGEEANEKLKSVAGDLLHLKMDVEMESGISFEILFRGNRLLNYDVGYSRFNDVPYISDQPGSLRFSVEMLIDKTSVETYIGNGKLFISGGLKQKKTDEGIWIKGNVKIHSMEIQTLHSIW